MTIDKNGNWVIDMPIASKYVDGLGSLPKDYSLAGNTENMYLDNDWRSYMPDVGSTAVNEMTALQNGVNSAPIEGLITNAPEVKYDFSGVNTTELGLGDYAQKGLDWLGDKDNRETLGMIGNGVMTGLGYLQNRKVYDKNMQLLDQRIADNAEKMARRKALNAAWAATAK